MEKQNGFQSPEKKKNVRKICEKREINCNQPIFLENIRKIMDIGFATMIVAARDHNVTLMEHYATALAQLLTQ